MINWIDLPGLYEYVGANGHGIKISETHDGAQTVTSTDDAAVQALVDGYTVEDAKAFRKSQVVFVEANKFDDALTLAYGMIPPAAMMIKWPDKETEGRSWQSWDSGGRIGFEPATPIIDKEVTALRSRGTMVAKVVTNADALEALRGAIELRAGDLKDEIDAATDFAAVEMVDLSTGWPV